MPSRRRHRRLWVLAALLALAGFAWTGWWHFYIRQDFTLRDVRTRWKPKDGLELGEGWMRVNLPKNHLVEILFAVPKDAATGEPLPSASNLLFWAPYLGETNDPQTATLPPWALDYARECGWTVFTFTVKDGGEVSGKPRSYYIYPESGWHEVVFAAKAALETRYGLTSRALLVSGESAGGSLAEHLAGAHPEEIAAAAWSGGTTYMPLSSRNVVPCGFFSNWGCYGEPASRKLYEESSAQGLPLLWTELPPKVDGRTIYHHAPSELTARMKRCFLQGAVSLADPKTSAIPPMDSWPYAYEMPDGRTVRLPSEEFLRLWERLPHRLTHAVLSHQRDGFVAATEPVPDPAKTALFFYTDLGHPYLQDAVQALCRKNYAVHVVFCDDCHEQSCLDGAAALEAIRRDPRLAGLPLVVLGNGQAADAALKIASTVGETLAGVFLYDPRELIPEARRPRLSSDGTLNGAPVRRFLSGDPFAAGYTEISSEPIPDDPVPENQWLDYIQAVERFATIPSATEDPTP